VFGLFADLTLHPQFRKDQVELAKDKALEALRRMNDNPEDVSRREFRKIIYGKDHPYARTPTPETLKAIRREDLQAMHQRFFHPNAAWLAVSGDFESAAMKTKIERAFGAWPRADTTLPPVAAPPPALTHPQLYYIQLPINQSQIRIGELGLARHSPDHFAWEVFNELWGGSGTSRLFKTVRTQKGLAYDVGSAFSEPAQKGLIVAVSQTRGPQTIAAIRAIEEISSQTAHGSFAPDEVRSAKEAIQNRFVENYTSSAQIAEEIMNEEYFGFPSDYLDTYTAQIGKVGPQDLRRAGETYLHPERSAILVVGDLSTFDQPISTLGHPQEIKLEDYSEEGP